MNNLSNPSQSSHGYVARDEAKSNIRKYMKAPSRGHALATKIRSHSHHSVLSIHYIIDVPRPGECSHDFYAGISLKVVNNRCASKVSRLFRLTSFVIFPVEERILSRCVDIGHVDCVTFYNDLIRLLATFILY